MGLLRTNSVLNTVRKISYSNRAIGETILKTGSVPVIGHFINKNVKSNEKSSELKSLNSLFQKKTITVNKDFTQNNFQHSRINDVQVQSLTESKRMAKLFSSFDLSSVQISFVGLIGDFAVWAITDLTTGDIEYIIDDSGGSIVEDFTDYIWLISSAYYRVRTLNLQ